VWIAGFNVLDLRQQLVEISGHDGFAHRLDKLFRQVGQGFGRELGRFNFSR
jgi:hypothetical protein